MHQDINQDRMIIRGQYWLFYTKNSMHITEEQWHTVCAVLVGLRHGLAIHCLKRRHLEVGLPVTNTHDNNCYYYTLRHVSQCKY